MIHPPFVQIPSWIFMASKGQKGWWGSFPVTSWIVGAKTSSRRWWFRSSRSNRLMLSYYISLLVLCRNESPTMGLPLLWTGNIVERRQSCPYPAALSRKAGMELQLFVLRAWLRDETKPKSSWIQMVQGKVN